MEEEFPILFSERAGCQNPPVGIYFKATKYMTRQTPSIRESRSSYLTGPGVRCKGQHLQASDIHKEQLSLLHREFPLSGTSVGNARREDDISLCPPAEPITDFPPYKPTRTGTISLTMMQQNRSPSDSLRKVKVSKYDSSIEEIQRDAYWWLPQSGCDLNAAVGARHLQTTSRCHLRKKHLLGLKQERGQYQYNMHSLPAAPIVTRRWSSVEPAGQAKMWSGICSRGAQPRHLKSSTTSLADRLPRSSNDDTTNAVSHILIPCKLCSPMSLTPAEITLRRASEAQPASEHVSNRSSTRRVKALFTTDTMSLGVFTPRARQVLQSSDRCLITGQNVNAITALIGTSAQKPNQVLENKVSVKPPSFVSKNTSRCGGTCFTEKGLVISHSSPSVNPIVKPEVQSSLGQHNNAAVSLESASASKPSQSRVMFRSRHESSKHEIIWQGTSAATDPSCYGDEPCCAVFEDSKHTSLRSRSLGTANLLHMSQEAYKTSDPDITRDTMEPWGAEMMLRSAPTAQPYETSSAESSDSDVLQDVVSFPPLLKRNCTADWYSPLPDISDASTLACQTPDQTWRRPNFEDWARVLRGSSSDTACASITLDSMMPPFRSILPGQPKTGHAHRDRISKGPSRSPLSDIKLYTGSVLTDKEIQRGIAPTELHRSPSKRFKAGLTSKSSDNVSSTRLRPVSLARMGRRGSVGSSIGVSSSVRRKHSAHISFMPNLHREESTSAWVKPRKDSGYPTIQMLAASGVAEQDNADDDAASSGSSSSPVFMPDTSEVEISKALKTLRYGGVGHTI